MENMVRNDNGMDQVGGLGDGKKLTDLMYFSGRNTSVCNWDSCEYKERQMNQEWIPSFWVGLLDGWYYSQKLWRKMHFGQKSEVQF